MYNDYLATMEAAELKGVERGIEKEKLQTARELKLKGMNADFIHDITKLPIETIEAL